MKKLLNVVLTVLMTLSFVGCSSSEESTTATVATEGTTESTDSSETSSLKIGAIILGDENEGYSYAHIAGIKSACESLGIDESNVIWKYNVSESQAVYDAAVDCIENGATLILSNSYGHQTYMQQVASEYPEVTVIAVTGDTAAVSGLSNLHNGFNKVYESRYVSGVVAGLKLKELEENGELVDANYNEDGEVKIGYVGAYPYSEVVSGFTAFYLGVKSVYENVHMYVKYTNSWSDITAEGTVADELMAQGCVIISQHADTTGAPSTIQSNDDSNKYGFNAYSVGYNISMLDVAPTAALTSASANWEVFYEYAFSCALNGEEMATDFAKGYEANAVGITELGSSAAAGTSSVVAEVETQLAEGSLQVFDVTTFTYDGETPTTMLADVDADYTPETEGLIDGYFHESEFRSAPYFPSSQLIDGITAIGEE
jgi:basic membrane protein A and related proteins